MNNNKNNLDVLGIHHITAIAGNPQKNIDFYTGILGLRLVKLTVNFDDPTTYHLYYGDEIGHPGTILTFFPWQHMPRGYRGTGQVVTISFLIPENAMEYWTSRLKNKGIEFTGPINRFDGNEQIITFYDPDGLELELVAHKVAEERKSRIWKNGPIPEDYATRGFYTATISLVGYERTASLLTKDMGFSKIKHEGSRFRFEIKNKENLVKNYSNTQKRELELSMSSTSSSTSIVDLVCLPLTKRGYMGVGTVHHIAWRTPTDESQIIMRKAIVNTGLDATPVIDRTYFHSVYFREPGGVLFEIATDSPGFMVDQKLEELGQKLVLPKWLEPDRIYIEKILPSLTIKNINHNNSIDDSKAKKENKSE
jgi:glyoxalase family protein